MILTDFIQKLVMRYGVPSGSIMAWHGDANSVPDGWAICDGTNGTPDLRGRFILGVSNDNSFSFGKIGGSHKYYRKLSYEQMPKHNHYIFVDSNADTKNPTNFPATSKLVSIGGSMAFSVEPTSNYVAPRNREVLYTSSAGGLGASGETHELEIPATPPITLSIGL